MPQPYAEALRDYSLDWKGLNASEIRWIDFSLIFLSSDIQHIDLKRNKPLSKIISAVFRELTFICFSIVTVTLKMKKRIQSLDVCLRFFHCGPSWARTSDPLIMSQVLLTS